MSTVRTARFLVFFLLASCANASPLDPAMKAVEQIRGRKFVRAVKTVSIDRSALAAHLREQMEKSTPYPLDDWGHILRSLQLVDTKTEDIVPKLLALYESQVLAFYDPHSHTYYSIKQLPKLPEGAAALADPKLLEETVMVHELMHALQDQQFGLSEKEKALIRDTDANLAYHALLEGEAVLVMVAHMLNKAGADFEEVMRDDTLVSMVTSAAQAEQMIDSSTPKYFGEMLKFPYIDGVKFAIAAYRRGGWKELDKIHARPPRSTREILHPEEYFEQTFKPEPFDATKPAGDWMTVEHLGEFHWRFLVGEPASRGWVNDRVSVARSGRVHAETKWQSPEAAETFAVAYSDFLSKRGLKAHVSRTGSAVVADYTAR